MVGLFLRGSFMSAAASILLLSACSPNGGSRGTSVTPDSGTTTTDGGAGTDGAPGYDAGPRPDVPFVPRPGDRDNDGLPDEDEVARGTDPDNADSDGDGYSDGVEVLAGTDPTDASSAIPATDFYVILEHNGPAEVRELDFTARLGKGDVAFLIDTTGSMGVAIGNVRSSLAGTIVPAISDAIADVQMAVADYRDFPVDPFGSGGDWSYVLRQEMTSDVSAVQTALNGLSAGGGGDGPEAMTEGLHSVAAGPCAGAGFGSVCFREDSHPIVVVVTDALSHNGPGGAEAYTGATAGMARTWAETTAAMNAREIKLVGVAVSGIPLPIPIPFPIPAQRGHLDAMATATNSRSADGALTVFESDGGEVSTAVVGGIADLVGSAMQDVTSRTVDDPSDAVDATQFIKSVAPLRATRATTFDATTFFGVAGGTTITFEVTFLNDFVPHENFVQIFRAEIEVHDVPGGTVLDTRQVYIVVPHEDGSLI